MEEHADGWLTVLEKNGLGPAAGILENYGIDSEADLFVLDQDDFSKLASRGLKPLYAKKLERWCGAPRDSPASSALLSSESLNVVTPTAHSVGAEESECESGSENGSESDGEDDDDSDDALAIVGEESGTADSTGVFIRDRNVGQKGQDHTDSRATEICETVPPYCVLS
jgi:hypothetical protein